MDQRSHRPDGALAHSSAPPPTCRSRFAGAGVPGRGTRQSWDPRDRLLMPEAPRELPWAEEPCLSPGQVQASPGPLEEGRTRSLPRVLPDLQPKCPLSPALPSKLKDIANQITKDLTGIDFNLKPFECSLPLMKGE